MRERTMVAREMILNRGGKKRRDVWKRCVMATTGSKRNYTESRMWAK